MKKAVAMVMVVVMMLALCATALAEGVQLTVNQAKQEALDYVGVKAYEANFTKAHRDWDDRREVYEIEFYANNTEFDMDVDVNTGRITDFSSEYHGGGYNTQSTYSQPAYGAYRDWDDWDDMYDRDYDDWFDWDD